MQKSKVAVFTNLNTMYKALNYDIDDFNGWADHEHVGLRLIVELG